MSGATGGDLAQIAQLRNGLGRRHWDVGAEARDVGAAIRRFRSRSSDYVPPLPPHAVRGAELADRLDELGHRVAATRDALAAADRWVGADVARWLVERHGDWEAAQAGWYGVRGSWSRFRRWTLGLDHPADGWGHAEFKRALGQRARWLETDEIRDLRDQLNARNAAIRSGLDRIDESVEPFLRRAGLERIWHDTLADARHVLGRGPSPASAADDAASWLGRAVASYRTSRLGAVTRIGGTALGVVGAGVGVLAAVDGFQEGDTEKMVTNGLGAVAGAAMMTGIPPVQLAGAVVTGGLLVYEYREELATGARAVGRGISSGARAVAGGARAVTDAVGDHVRQQVETAGRVVGGVGDMAGAAASFVGGLF